MGSFANSIHVYQQSAEAVANAVEAVLQNEGYAPTDERADFDAFVMGEDGLRTVLVVQAPGDWVGVLDSNLMLADALARTLSEELTGVSLTGMVNDSDSWHYQLYKNGEPLDSFSSLPEELAEGEFGGGFGDQLSPEAMTQIEEMQQETQQMYEQFFAAMPPEIAELARAMHHQTGEPLTQEQMMQYSLWMTQEGSEVMASFQQQLTQQFAGLTQSMNASFDDQSPGESGAGRNVSSHVEILSEVLPGAVSPKLVEPVLNSHAVFAEEIYAAFFQAIGIHEMFAHLSYAYWDEVMSYPDAANELTLHKAITMTRG